MRRNSFSHPPFIIPLFSIIFPFSLTLYASHSQPVHSAYSRNFPNCLPRPFCVPFRLASSSAAHFVSCCATEGTSYLASRIAHYHL